MDCPKGKVGRDDNLVLCSVANLVVKKDKICTSCQEKWVGGAPPDKVEDSPVLEAFKKSRTVIGRVASAAGAVVAWASNGMELATIEERQKRLAACKQCSHWGNRRCDLCGCYTDAKLIMKTEKCPIGKW